MISRSIMVVSCIVIQSLRGSPDMPETNDALLLQLLQHNKISAGLRQPWRPIHEESRDTVVQVFAQIAETDILQPYKTPAQYGGRGTGFFINDSGHFITNAHAIDQAIAIWIRIPSLGKRLIDVQLIGICPERDIALLRVSDKEMRSIRAELGMIPYLVLGDSDAVHRADEVLALGYPLGQESLKSTTGVISGRQGAMIQMSAPINPGSSGGPLLNIKGEVVGITSSGIMEAQNVGYIIPINDLKSILADLYTTFLLRRPSTGIVPQNGNESLIHYLGNPLPGGTLVTEVIKDSPADKAGIERFDMIYQINGYPVDIYGDMKVPWSEDKLSIDNYAWGLPAGNTLEVIFYRNGERKQCTIYLNQSEPLPIRKIYYGCEKIDYEVFGGLVVMHLTLNHLKLMHNHVPGLAKYTETRNQTMPMLIITHIFPNSQLAKSRTIMPGFVLHEVNGKKVHTLDELRASLSASITTGYLTLKASDTISRLSDNIFVVLPFATVCQEERMLSQVFHYQITPTVEDLLQQAARN